MVSALKNYSTLFCFPHRLNNILKCSFFQSQAQEKTLPLSNSAARQMTNANPTNIADAMDSVVHPEAMNTSPVSTDCENDKNEHMSSTENEITNMNLLSLAHNAAVDPRKAKFKDLAPQAQEIIKMINRCKNLVQFVKKVS